MRKPRIFLFNTEVESVSFSAGVRAQAKLNKYDGVDMCSFGPDPTQEKFTVELHPYMISDYEKEENRARRK